MPEPSPEFVRLQNAVRAVDRLNSWVRSESYRRYHSGAKEFVYFLKRTSIQAMHQWSDAHAGDLNWENRLTLHNSIVVVPSSCRTCSGSGIWRDWNSDATGPCNRCHASGQRVLTFVETRAYAGWIQCAPVVSWHSPTDDWPLVRPDSWPHETAWRPNQKGQDLTPAEVAAALNIAEEYFKDFPRAGGRNMGEVYAIYPYRLDVGETLKVCHFCGTEGDDENPVTRYGCHRGSISWSDHACRRCADRSPVCVFDRFAFPDALCADPAIVEWRERHSMTTEVQKGAND